MSRSYQQTAAVCAICPAHSATSTGSIDLSAALSVEFAVERLSKEHRQEGLHTLRFKHRLELIKSTERARQEEKHLLTLWPKFTRWRPLDRNRDSNRLSGLNQKFHSNKLCVFNHVCRNAYAKRKCLHTAANVRPRVERYDVPVALFWPSQRSHTLKRVHCIRIFKVLPPSFSVLT